MAYFSAEIFIIGVNPYVFLPKQVLEEIFIQAGKKKGPIQVRGKINGHDFLQTLVKFSGYWRLYLNTPMRRNAGIDVGDTANVEIEFDPELRIIEMHPKLQAALAVNEAAKAAFEGFPPYRKKEIVRYLANLKSDLSIEKNVEKIIQHLLGKERFAGRDK